MDSIALVLGIAGMFSGPKFRTAGPDRFFRDLARTIAARKAEFARIPGPRKNELLELTRLIREQLQARSTADITFICTHNSRRSHLAQVWAQVAATHYGVAGIRTYSGGTQATAFNPRAVSALERAGFRIQQTSPGANPIYAVNYSRTTPPLQVFSKLFDQAPNPKNGFGAVMTCSQADLACPIVPGSVWRVAIPFDDPQDYDGTDQETAIYDARCRQICREMLFVFSLVSAPWPGGEVAILTPDA